MSATPTEVALVLRGEPQTLALGRALARLLRPGDILALHGELGAGKTTLVRGLAAGLGIQPTAVHSPTFVLANVYRAPPPSAGAAPPFALVHVDAYRLDDADALDTLGWDRLREGSAAMVIEWAERISAALPPDRLDVSLEHASENSRRVTLRTHAQSWRDRLADLRFDP